MSESEAIHEGSEACERGEGIEVGQWLKELTMNKRLTPEQLAVKIGRKLALTPFAIEFIADAIRAAKEEARKDEREACAKVAENQYPRWRIDYHSIGELMAEAIRKRGKPTP